MKKSDAVKLLSTGSFTSMSDYVKFLKEFHTLDKEERTDLLKEVETNRTAKVNRITQRREKYRMLKEELQKETNKRAEYMTKLGHYIDTSPEVQQVVTLMEANDTAIKKLKEQTQILAESLGNHKDEKIKEYYEKNGQFDESVILALRKEIRKWI